MLMIDSSNRPPGFAATEGATETSAARAQVLSTSAQELDSRCQAQFVGAELLAILRLY